MARGKKLKDKQHEKEHQIYKAGDRYQCIECGTEVNYGENCPNCKANINWHQIEGQVRCL
jgi:rubrerythrin